MGDQNAQPPGSLPVGEGPDSAAVGAVVASGPLEMVCVGDELLDGRNADRHVAWFGTRLGREGLGLARATLVGDGVDEIADALRGAASRARYVLVSGGLGPTEDDRTRDAAAALAGVALAEHPDVLEGLRARYAARGIPFPESNRRQAFFPEGSERLPTEVGTASGFRLRVGGCVLDFVPGVPRELYWFVERYTMPLLAPSGGQGLASRLWRLFGLGESAVADLLEGIDFGGLSLHYLAHFPEVHVFIRALPGTEASRFEAVETEVGARLARWVIAEGEETALGCLATGLRSRGWSLAVAESCTGGQLGMELTSVAGSSEWFREGAVTYSNAAKQRQLGVSGELLRAHGAVSAPVAAAMAAGIRDASGADVALALTGIAGPGGGTDEKPVGTVFLGVATPEGVGTRDLRLYGFGRAAIRTLSTWSAIATLLWYLDGRLPADWLEWTRPQPAPRG
jgi:nicotinamide-nucleotide amidase